MPPTLNRGGKGYIFASHKLAKFPIIFVLVKCEIREFCGEMSFKYQFYYLNIQFSVCVKRDPNPPPYHPHSKQTFL